MEIMLWTVVDSFKTLWGLIQKIFAALSKMINVQIWQIEEWLKKEWVFLFYFYKLVEPVDQNFRNVSEISGVFFSTQLKSHKP